jgi:hypothetical protein
MNEIAQVSVVLGMISAAMVAIAGGSLWLIIPVAGLWLSGYFCAEQKT